VENVLGGKWWIVSSQHSPLYYRDFNVAKRMKGGLKGLGKVMKQYKRPTIADVAKRAGVSIGTVSNVINDVIPVRKLTRDRVTEAIAELDFRQNMLAQGLRSKRSPIVGLCVPHTSITYFSELVDAFEEVASNNNVAIMQVLSRDDPEREYQRVETLLNYRVGGLILVPTIMPDKTYDMVSRSGVPMVVVDRAAEDAFPFDKVIFDNSAAMRKAGAGLLQRGHRNILFVCHQQYLNVTQQRLAGLRAAADSAPYDVTINIITCADQSALTTKLAVQLRKGDRPTAVIVSNSKLASWFYRAANTLMISCPEAVSIIAFDEPDWADIVTPTLSVVRQPTRDMAIMAWRFLLNRIDDESIKPQEIQLQAEIVFRESVFDYTTTGYRNGAGKL
jgi:LacI family transcriptional regulator